MSDATLAEAYKHCESLSRAYDRDRWVSALFAPPETRSALHALSAFFYETRRIKGLVQEPLMGEMRLTWWREAIDGARAGEAAAHPVAAALTDAIRRRGLPVGAFEDYLIARRDALYREAPADVAAAEDEGRSLHAAEYALAARALVDGLPDALISAQAAGQAAALAELDDSLGIRRALAHIDEAESGLARLAKGAAPAFAPLACLRLDLNRRSVGKAPAAPWRRQIAIWIWGRGR